jgi:pimeloyl-ACP methyl ester carboxylesterase
MVAHLRRQGWPADYLMAVDLRPNDGAIIAAAEQQLKPAARALLARAQVMAMEEGRPRPTKLAVLGHSMGAVSGRWLAAKLIPESVAVFIAIAGAHHGTDAVCGLAGAGNAEMCPAFPPTGRSAVLELLNGSPHRPLDQTPYGPAADPAGVGSVRPDERACINWYSLFIEPDEWIVPTSSARLPGSGGSEPRELPRGIERIAPGEYRLHERVRHDDLPASDAVSSLVSTLLLQSVQCGPI